MHTIRNFKHHSIRIIRAGARTTDIIEFYVHSIKILRGLDPTGILLEAVSGPTRQYLQTRKDAIRCIVSAMTDDSAMTGESLYDELHKPAEEVALTHGQACLAYAIDQDAKERLRSGLRYAASSEGSFRA